MSDALAVTIQEASRMTAIGRNELYRAVHDGELQAIRIGRRIVVPTHLLTAWLDDRASRDTQRHGR